MRFARQRTRDVDRALAAHLCRCTGWLTVRDAIARRRVGGDRGTRSRRGRGARGPRSKAGGAQRVDLDVPLGGAPFADDTAPRDALVAVPLPPGSAAECGRGRRACGGSSPTSLLEARRASRARCRAGARPSTRAPPLLDACPRARRAACSSRRSGSSPRTSSPTRRGASRAASRRRRSRTGARSAARRTRPRRPRPRELADRFGRTVRVVYSREDVVRLGPKRPPIAAVAVVARRRRRDRRRVARGAGEPRRVADAAGRRGARPLDRGRRSRAAGERRSRARSASPSRPCSSRARSAATSRSSRPSGARASAACRRRRRQGRRASTSTLAAGDPLDEIVLRSYAIGAAHMALGWVHERRARGRPRDRRDPRPHDPLVRRAARAETRRRST